MFDQDFWVGLYLGCVERSPPEAMSNRYRDLSGHWWICHINSLNEWELGLRCMLKGDSLIAVVVSTAAAGGKVSYLNKCFITGQGTIAPGEFSGPHNG